ncbi:hypothetical protein QBC43DRAFT_303575 [Cladorrhinum sp. PSN259]|nr:hypothetical protein QBC43DRAFT_303575 [Cladorrhinum sp. PSN259]
MKQHSSVDFKKCPAVSKGHRLHYVIITGRFQTVPGQGGQYIQRQLEEERRKFVHSELISLFDEFLVDGFTTGLQRLVSLGRRWQIARKPGQRHSHLAAPNGDNSVSPLDEVAYISAKQGVYNTSDPILKSRPYFRNRAYRAVLLRSKTRIKKYAVKQGEICGMFHFADLTARNATEASSYLIYADAFDPLTDYGWTIKNATALQMNGGLPPAGV